MKSAFTKLFTMMTMVSAISVSAYANNVAVWNSQLAITNTNFAKAKIATVQASVKPKQQQLEQMRLESRQQVANLSWQVPAQDMIQMFYQVLVPATITREDRVKYASTKINHAIVSPQC